MRRTFFFDFDGVIVDSTRIKTDAFYELFMDHGEDVARVFKEYHMQNQGVDRYKKIQYAFAEILHLPCSDETLARYADKFSRIVFEKVLTCDFVPGALDFLRRLKNDGFQSFLLSATPEGELKDICKARGLEDFFAEICGSPLSKPEHGERIMKEHHIARESIIFFGDSPSDLLASRALDVAFMGITYKNDYRFADDITTIPDFCGDYVTPFFS